MTVLSIIFTEMESIQVKMTTKCPEDELSNRGPINRTFPRVEVTAEHNVMTGRGAVLFFLRWQI